MNTMITTALFVVFYSISLSALVIRSNDLNNGLSHSKLGSWKTSSRQRIESISSGNAIDIISNMASNSTTPSDIYSDLESRYDTHYSESTSGNSSPTEAFLSFFISTDKNSLGLSQVVLEVALACKWFDGGSEADFRDDLCKTYPKLAHAVLMLISNKLPGKTLTYNTYEDFTGNSVEHGRGLVLVRALTPLFIATGIQDSTLNQHWSATASSNFRSLFTSLETEVNESLRDFFIQLAMRYKPSSVPSRTFFSTLRTQYNVDTAIDDCDELRVAKASWIQRCTSNHVMIGYLGRLMMAHANGETSLSSHRDNFRKLVEKGIHYKSGKHYFSDTYRTSQLKEGERERRGYTYSLLQARTLVLAADMLLKKGVTNLYSHGNRRLLKGLDFLAFVGERKRNYSSIYFSSSDESSKNSNFRNKFFHSAELNKYVYTIGGTSQENRTRRENYARSYGFFLIVKKHICVNSTNIDSYPNLCRDEASFSTWNNIDNITPRTGTNIESINSGPVQILFY